MTLFMRPEKLATAYPRNVNVNSPTVGRGSVPGTLGSVKTVYERENEALLPPPSSSSGFCSEYITNMNTLQRALPDPHDHHEYLEVDVINRLRSLQSEVDMLKNSVQTSGNSVKSKDSCIYEKIEHKPRRPSPPTYKPSKLTQEARSRGLYGVGRVCDRNTAICCRAFWVLLLIGCFGMAVFHITDRVLLFYSSPYHYYISRDSVDSLSYPAVTVCNLNQFKLTEVAKLDLYDVLYASLHVQTGKSISFQKYSHRLNMTYADFSRRTGHSKVDFIYRCQWQNGDCGLENFTATFTDMGLCYTFSVHQDKRLVTKPGQQSGLFLALNVEQYEYILGPMSAVGAAIAVHGHGEPPVNFVNVPVGKYTSLELDKNTAISSSSLSCKGDNLAHCHQTCKDLHISQRCHCTFPPNWMGKGNYRECNMYDYIVCVRPWQEKRGDDCQCDMTNCDNSHYTMTSSYATIPKYGAESEVRTLRYHANIQERFRNALDTYHRVDRVIADYDKSTLHALSHGFKQCSNVSLQFIKYIKKYRENYKSTENKLKDKFNLYDRTIRVFYPFIENNQHLTFGTFIESTKLFMTAIDTLDSANIRTDASWTIERAKALITKVMWQLDRMVFTSTDKNNIAGTSPTLVRVLNGLIQFRKEVVNDVGNGAFKVFHAKRETYNAICDDMSSLVREIISKLQEGYNAIKSARDSDLVTMTTKLGIVFTDVSYMSSDMQKLQNQQNELIRLYHIDSLKVLEDMKKVDEMSQSFAKHFVVFNDNISVIVNVANKSTEILTDMGRRLGIIADDYSGGKFGKIELSNVIDEAGVMTTLNQLQKNINEPTSIIESLPTQGKKLAAVIDDVKEHLQEFNLAPPDNNVQDDAEDQLAFKELSSRSRDMITKIDQVAQSMTSYQGEIESYTTGRKIDESFYRNNFLYLDIYFKEMTDTISRRQKTYTLLDFSCDIGGVLALYLGVSLLTIFDIFDLISKMICCPKPSTNNNN